MQVKLVSFDAGKQFVRAVIDIIIKNVSVARGKIQNIIFPFIPISIDDGSAQGIAVADLIFFSVKNEQPVVTHDINASFCREEAAFAFGKVFKGQLVDPAGRTYIVGERGFFCLIFFALSFIKNGIDGPVHIHGKKYGPVFRVHVDSEKHG